MHYFKLQKFEFKQLTDDITINFYHLEILQEWRIYEDNVIQRWISQNSHPIKKY